MQFALHVGLKICKPIWVSLECQCNFLGPESAIIMAPRFTKERGLSTIRHSFFGERMRWKDVGSLNYFENLYFFKRI